MATIGLEEYEHLNLVHAETIRYLGKGNTKAQRLRCIETLLNTLSRGKQSASSPSLKLLEDTNVAENTMWDHPQTRASTIVDESA